MLLVLMALATQAIDGDRKWAAGGLLVTEASSPACPYKVVMDVEANVHSNTIFGKRPSADKAVREMRERVAKAHVGADAIIEARFSPEHASAVWGRVVTGTGKAVKFVDRSCAPS
jgi:hypothetical protein